MDATITIDPERCRHDDLCVRICPASVFAASEGEAPAVDRTEHCCLCGQCVAACANDAIVHGGLDRARFERVTERRPVDAEAFRQAVLQRRSVRNYKRKPVPRDVLERIVSVAGYAPGSSHKGIGWERHVIVVTGEDAMQTVLEHTVEYLKQIRDLLDSFLLRTVERFSEEAHSAREAVLPDATTRLAELEAGRDRIIYDAPAAVFVHAATSCVEPQADCDAALLSLLLVADAFGLGACWNGWISKAASGDHLKSFTRLGEFLGLPEGHRCYAAATIGYPSLRLHSVPDRRTSIRWVGSED